MANSWYAKGREAFATAQVNWPTDATIRVSIVDLADYTPNLATDQFYSIIPSGAIVASGALTGRTATDGVLDAADLEIPGVTGDQAEALVIWKDTGTTSTSRLLFFIDSASGDWPLVPNGAGVTIQWNVAGIARL